MHISINSMQASYRWDRVLHLTALSDVNSFLLAMSTGSNFLMKLVDL